MVDRFSEYRIMWVMVLFDLPTDTKKERKMAAKFRKELIEDGFTMFQYSIYIRHCASAESADVHKARIRRILPEYGKVTVMRITDKQFGDMEVFDCQKPAANRPQAIQLELF